MNCPQKTPFHLQKAFYSHKPFLLPSKATLFHPPLPIPTTLNLLSAKNTAVLLLFALILCCKAGTSHRFKSLPAIPDEVAAFRKTGYLMMAAYFSENHVSTGDLNRPRSPEVRKPLACFWFFSYKRKAQKRLLCRELRGSANLESTHRSDISAPQQLKPFKGASRFSKPRSNTQKNKSIQSN